MPQASCISRLDLTYLLLRVGVSIYALAQPCRPVLKRGERGRGARGGRAMEIQHGDTTSECADSHNKNSKGECEMASVQTKKVEVPNEIVQLCNDQLKKAETWPSKLTGQVAYYEVAKKILTTIRDGGGLTDVQSIIKTSSIPFSFSQIGAWMPRELHRHIGRLVDEEIFIVKTSGFRVGEPRVYREAAELEAEGKKVDWDNTMPGTFARCMRCDSIYATKEPAHQAYCNACESERLRAKGGRGGTTVARSKLPADAKRLIAIGGNIIRLRATDEKKASAMLVLLNEERAKIKKGALTMEDVKKFKSVAELIN